jgi:hypothetical protein
MGTFPVANMLVEIVPAISSDVMVQTLDIYG